MSPTHIELVTFLDAPPERAFELARDIGVHERSMARTGERAVAGRTSGLIGPGETVTFVARQLGVRWRLTSRVTSNDWDPPRRFVDEQVAGPFRVYRHMPGGITSGPRPPRGDHRSGDGGRPYLR
jgi:ligand-binding SRPBCC domain-containing protein